MPKSDAPLSAMPDGGRAHGKALLTMFFWGQMIPCYAVLLHTFDAVALSAARYLVGAPFMIATTLYYRCFFPLPAGPALKHLTLLGVGGMGGLVLLSTVGLALSGPVNAIFILAGAPLVHTVIAVAFYGERLVHGSGVAFMFAVPGMVLVSLDGAASSGGFHGGELLLIASSICWSWYSLQARVWMAGDSHLRITCYTMLTAMPFLMCVFFVAQAFGLSAMPASPVGASTVLLLLWLVATSTCLGVVLWHSTVSELGMTVAAIYLSLVPFFGLLVGLVFGFQPSLVQIAGGLMIVAGVLQIYLRRIFRQQK